MAISVGSLLRTILWVDEGATVDTRGNTVILNDTDTWISPIFGLNDALMGGWSVDLQIDSNSGTPDAVVELLGGNYRDGRTELPSLVYSASDLPSFLQADLGVPRLINVDNQRTNFGQLKITCSGVGGQIQIAHALFKKAGT